MNMGYGSEGWGSYNKGPLTFPNSGHLRKKGGGFSSEFWVCDGLLRMFLVLCKLLPS